MRIPVICELVCGLITQEFSKTHSFLSCSAHFICLCRICRTTCPAQSKRREGPGYRQWLNSHSRFSNISPLFRAQIEKSIVVQKKQSDLSASLLTDAAIPEFHSTCSWLCMRSTLTLVMIHNLSELSFSICKV